MALNTKEIYQYRINKAIDYINTNLDRKLCIDEISNEVCFSPFHFHRIFKSFVGESIYAYINRLRVEKAAALLLTTMSSVTDVAYTVGFRDSAVFARAFKGRFGCSASSWIQKKNSKIHQVHDTSFSYSKREGDHRMITPKNVCVTKISERKLIYVRNVGSFSGNPNIFMDLHHRLLAELIRNPIAWDRDKGFFAVYHDSSGIADDHKQRISYGVISEDEIPADKILGSFRFWENDYLVACYTLANDEYGKAWTSLFRDTIPSMGLEPADGFCFENYAEDCYNSVSKKTVVRIGVPVKKIK